MSTDSPPSLLIGDWLYVPDQQRLCREGDERRLPRRLAQLLNTLAASPAQTVDRATLLAAAWERRPADEEALSRAIAELRLALGDEAKEPRYIETIPKLGYRLIADVTPIAAATVPIETMPLPPRRRWIENLTILVPVLLVFLWVGGMVYRASGKHAASPEPPWTATRLAREHPFLSGSGRERDPRFSPDGRWLAFVRDEPDGQGQRVWIAQRDGAEARPLNQAIGRYASPVFVPGSSEIVYETRGDDGCAVMRHPLFGEGGRRIADCARDADASGLDFSADGQRLLFVSPGTDGGGAIAMLDAQGRVTLLTAPSAGDGPDALPRFAPDQQHVSFVRGSVSERRLLDIGLSANASPRVLIADRNRIDGIAWTPQGTQLVLATDRHDYRALIALDPATGKVERLGGRGAAGLDIARDGSLIYVQQIYVSNLYRADLHESVAPQALTHSTRYVSQPALSPDDMRLAYVSTGEGRETVWLRDLVTGDERKLPLDPALRWVRPAFAADGDSLLLTGYADDGAHVWRHTLADGRTQRVAGLPTQAFALRESTDGQRIVAVPRDAHFALLRFANDHSQPIVGAEAVDEFQLDRHWLVFAAADGTLRLRDLDRVDDATPALPAIDAKHRYAWHLRDGALYFVATIEGAAQLFRFDLASQARTSLGIVSPNTVGPNLQVSKDLEFAIFGHVDRIDVDLMLAEP